MSVLEESIIDLASEKCIDLLFDQLERAFFDTPEIEKKFHVSRTQASRAANKLVEGYLTKVNKRSVSFVVDNLLLFLFFSKRKSLIN